MLVAHIVPPKYLKAFPKAVPVKRKGKLRAKRKRWRDDDFIYEWDSLHGTVEKYTKNRHHLGDFDPETGAQVGDAVKGREIEP